MMAIKGWQRISILFLMFSYLPFFSQSTQELINHDFESRTYDLSWIQSSPNGRYVNFQKVYEYNSDTLALVDFKKPNHLVFQSPNIHPGTVSYTKKGYLFMSGSHHAQLLKLPDLKPVVWKNIRKAIYLEAYHIIAILQDKALVFYNEEGAMVGEKQLVISTQYKDKRLFLTTQVSNGFELVEWKPSGEILRYESDTEKIAVDFCDSSSLIIHKNNSKKQDAEIIFINIENDGVVTLRKPFQDRLTQVSGVNKLPSGGYLIRLLLKSNIPKEGIADIWYENDPDLENKFRNGQVLKFVIWKPLFDEVIELDNVEYSRYININNPKFLVAVHSNQQDYTKWNLPYQLSKYDVQNRKYIPLGFIGSEGTVDKEGRFLLSRLNGAWMLYDIETSERRTLAITNDGKAYFDEEGAHVLFEGKNHITEYDIKNGNVRFIQILPGFDAVFANATSNAIGMDIRITQRYFSAERPLLIKTSNSEKSKQAYGIYSKKRFRILSKPSEDYIDLGQVSKDGKTLLYVKSNYNRAPTLIVNSGSGDKIIYQSNPNDKTTAQLRMERINFKNSQGLPLQGILYYPNDFELRNRYPMIVGIYEAMRNQGNRYLRDGFSGSVEGMNVRHFLENGYFVFLPDIVYDGRGPGKSALDCVESSLDVLQGITNIDFEKVGLIGHSFGGYETNFIATQSKRFATYVGGAGNSDLVRSFHSFNYNYKRPFYWKFEEHQYRMFKPFADDKNLYIDNSPIYHAEKVERPILLWAGTADTNVPWDQSMEFYLGLRRNHKNVIALFYKDEGHSFDHRANREDLFVKISQWFDYHLKGVKNFWIEEMYK